MTSRIDRRFAKLKSEGRKALITFVTAATPTTAPASRSCLASADAGADVIELGMPFSDPMADGPAIQAASVRALKSGQTMKKTLAMVRSFRAKDKDTPIVLMGYYNPIYVYPSRSSWTMPLRPAVDGLIIVDAPPEADDELCIPAVQRGLNFIRLATPTTDDARLPAVLKNTSGFVYYDSITGITGSAAPDVKEVHAQVARIKRATQQPLCVGFGVTTQPKQSDRCRRGWRSGRICLGKRHPSQPRPR